MPIKARQIAFNHPQRPGNGTGVLSHVAIVDDKGRVWERFSDMPPGEWTLVPLPEEPKPARKPSE